MALKRVLIVDDTVDVGRLYQETIRSAYPGAPIVYVPSAEEGLLEASRFPIDLLVTDIRLPGISGFDLVRKIRLRQPEVKVIMVTGLMIDADLERQSREVGAQLLLPKPLSLEEFVAAVEKVTGEPGQIGAARQVAAPIKRSRRTTGGLRQAVNEPKTTPAASRPPVDAPEPVAGRLPRAVEPELEPDQPTLGSALGDLRGSLGALAVILLDDQGRTAAKAGEWPAPELEAHLAPEVMSGLSALEKVSHQLRPGLPLASHVLRGQAFDLAFAPVGRFAVLVFLRGGGGALRLALVFEQLLSAQAQLAGILEGMGMVIRPVTGLLPVLPEAQVPAATVEVQLVARPEPEEVAEPEPEDPARLDALEALLENPARPAAELDAETFWDQVATDEKPSAPSTGALSYEQAQKLGLVGDGE